MKITNITLAIVCATLPMTGVYAAALDRSGQPIGAFLQPNNYFEAGISGLSAEVKGVEAGTSTAKRPIDNMAKDYVFGTAAIKLQPTEQFSVGLIFDQPFGANASYQGTNDFVSNNTNTVLPAAQLSALGAGTIATVAKSTFDGLTAQQRVGAALTAQGVNLTTPAGQAQFAATLNSYNTNPAVKTQIDTGVEAGVRAQVTQRVNAGLAAANNSLGKGETKVKIQTESLSLLFGFQPNQNWNVYAGPVLQNIKGDVSLRGQAYSLYNGYDAKLDDKQAWGWLAGIAYQVPDIALKASVTYRSKIKYDAQFEENMSGLVGALPIINNAPSLGGPVAAGAITAAQTKAGSQTTSFSTPQSVNLDLQSGIMANTVAFANVRWVNWKDFSIRPYLFGAVSDVVGKLPSVGRPNGFDLVAYEKDQWSANVGVGRKFSDKFSGSVSVGWDSGAGDPVSTLGPTKGFYNVGLGGQYSPAKNYFVQGGIKYFWLGDTKAQTGSQFGGPGYVAEFADNKAIAGALKVGYRF
ncbi:MULTISPECIES: long-chain fatty acid transporter [unclassified Acinetobacter]|uniref:long-chain fatty acid transporter n=1 Tax=unclassified Acinetobacter TaxID=196816 RepID=UPI0035B7245A